MARRMALAFERFDRAELKLCRYLNRSSSRAAVRQLFRAASWLGDGWLWYGVIASLPFLYGREGAGAAVHMALTGAVGVLVYKLIKTRAVRERPYITHSAIHCVSAPLDRYSFPSGHTLHAISFTMLIAGYFPEWTAAVRGGRVPDRAIPRDFGPALPDRRRGRCGARRRAGHRKPNARATVRSEPEAARSEPLPSDQSPDDRRQQQAHEHGRGSQVLGLAGERMMIRADAIDDEFHGGVEELHDQHEQTRSDQERALHGVAAEPEGRRYERDAKHALLPKRCLVLPCSS